MRAIMWTGGENFEAGNMPEPEIDAGKVKVKVEAAATLRQFQRHERCQM